MTMPRALLSAALLMLTGDALTASSQVNAQTRIFLCEVDSSFARVSKLSVAVVLATAMLPCCLLTPMSQSVSLQPACLHSLM